MAWIWTVFTLVSTLCHPTELLFSSTHHDNHLGRRRLILTICPVCVPRESGPIPKGVPFVLVPRFVRQTTHQAGPGEIDKYRRSADLGPHRRGKASPTLDRTLGRGRSQHGATSTGPGIGSGTGTAQSPAWVTRTGSPALSLMTLAPGGGGTSIF